MIDETNEWLEIYRGADIALLTEKELKELKVDLLDKKPPIEECLEVLYKSDQISNSGKISMIESTIRDLDRLLEEVSQILEASKVEKSEDMEEELEEQDEEIELEEELEPEEEETEEILEEEEFEQEESEPSMDEIETEEPIEEEPEQITMLEIPARPSKPYMIEATEALKNANINGISPEEAVENGTETARKLMNKLNPPSNTTKKRPKKSTRRNKKEKEEKIR